MEVEPSALWHPPNQYVPDSGDPVPLTVTSHDVISIDFVIPTLCPLSHKLSDI